MEVTSTESFLMYMGTFFLVLLAIAAIVALAGIAWSASDRQALKSRRIKNERIDTAYRTGRWSVGHDVKRY